MLLHNTKVNNITLTETEKDILDKAFDIIDALDNKLSKYLVIDETKIYTHKEIMRTIGLLEDLVDANSIIGG